MNLLAAASPDYTPFWILAAGVVFVIASIVKFRLHPFLGLTLGAILVGLITPELPGVASRDQASFMASYEQENQIYGEAPVAPDAEQKEKLQKLNIDPDGNIGGQNHLVKAIKLSMIGFGNLVGGIGFVIAMAAIIGVCMMESGAADRIVRRLMATLGEDRAAWAMLISGFVLSIPVFFDTVFFLLIPLARALALRTGKNYTLYVCAVAGAGAITHTIVPPTPGPLIIAENLGQPAGNAIIAGILAAVIPVAIVMWLANRFNDKLDIPIRETKGSSLDKLGEIVKKKDDELPGFGISVLPVLLPVVLISIVTFIGLAGKFGVTVPAELKKWLEFIGNKNVAMFIAALIAMYTLAKQRGWTFEKLGESMNTPLETAGVIILITGAGGAFGSMIGHSGIGDTIRAIGVSEGGTAGMLFMAWLLTAVIRAAQGSATVSMITGSGIMAPILAAMAADGSLGCHPIYFCLAIGFGAFPLSWMNDSGFWVVQRMSGFTEKETLKTWTVMLTAIGVAGIIQVIVAAAIFPMKPEAPAPEPEKTAMVSSVEGWASPENHPPLLPQQKSR